MPYAPKSDRQKRLDRLKKKKGRKQYDKKYDAKRKQDPLLEMARKLRSSGEWKKLKKHALKRDKYLCVDPFNYHRMDKRIEPATDVNHIYRIRERPDLALVLSNLASLCKDCHARISRLENRGKPVAHLFLKKPKSSESRPGLWHS